MSNNCNANVRAQELAELIRSLRKDGLKVYTTTSGNIAVENPAWRYTNGKDNEGNLLPCYYTEIGIGSYISLPDGVNKIII